MHEPARGSHLWGDRERRCRIERTAYELWLARVIPLRRIALGSATLFSALAAAAILGEPQFLADESAGFAAFCSLTSAVLTGLYVIKRPEAHQAECERLVRAYAQLETALAALHGLPDLDIPRQLRDWDAEFAATRDSAAAAPPDAFRERAERDVAAVRPGVAHHAGAGPHSTATSA